MYLYTRFPSALPGFTVYVLYLYLYNVPESGLSSKITSIKQTHLAEGSLGVIENCIEKLAPMMEERRISGQRSGQNSHHAATIERFGSLTLKNNVHRVGSFLQCESPYNTQLYPATEQAITHTGLYQTVLMSFTTFWTLAALAACARRAQAAGYHNGSLERHGSRAKTL